VPVRVESGGGTTVHIVQHARTLAGTGRLAEGSLARWRAPEALPALVGIALACCEDAPEARRSIRDARRSLVDLLKYVRGVCEWCGAYGCVWRCMGMHGCVWVCMGVHGVCMGVYGCV
jgi:hypothetical protein